MLKNYSLALISILIFATISQARITSLGEPAKFGIAPDPQAWDEINTHTWDVFTTFDSDEIFGVNQDRETIITTEFYSTGVMEGRKVGDVTAVASLTDRGAFFGGDGYLDLYYFAPVDKEYMKTLSDVEKAANEDKLRDLFNNHPKSTEARQ